MTISSKRAEYVALASLVLSIVFFLIAFFVGRWSGYYPVFQASWLILSAAFIWFVLWLQFHQQVLAEQEKLDMGHLAKGDESGRIFQPKGEHASLFAVAQKRLELLEKWFLPIFSALIAIYQIFMGWYLLQGFMKAIEVEFKQPLICAICMTAIAFVSFLISRYATGMSASNDASCWKPLRAGGSFFIGIAVLCFVQGVGLALAHFDIFFVLNVVGYIIPCLLIALGVETALNAVLDIYRPRLKGQYSRSAFDSRLLGVINEPGGIFRTAASAIDYQFGFKVSETWFYKLLEKAIVPLVLFAAVILYLLSCVVIVAPDEEVIIEHFGDPLKNGKDVRTAGPGLAFKWPWPVDIAYKYPTKRVMEISVGYVPKKYEPGQKREALLWGKEHHEKEYVLLVASEQAAGMNEGATPISLVNAAVPVQYRIKDLYSFIYNHKDSEELLESICYRELTRFAASAKIEVNDEIGSEADENQSLLGAGRAQAKKVLTERVQEAADNLGLGVEIVFLGLQGIHPPSQVAADYQKVIGAVQTKQAIILNAHAQRNQILSSLVGSVQEADRLYNLAIEYQQAKEQKDKKKIKELGDRLDAAFGQAHGDIFRILREAKSYAFEKTTLAEATGRRFASQLKAYRAAEEIYKREQRLVAFEEVLENVRKYVVVADTGDIQVFEVDVQEKLIPGLYDLGGFEESSEK